MNFMSDQACTPLGRVRWDGFCWDGLCCLGTGCAALRRVVLPWDGFCCLGTGLGWVMVPGGEFGTGLGWVLVHGGGFATGWGRPPAALAGTSSSST